MNLISVNRISLQPPARFELWFTGMQRRFLFQSTSAQSAYDWKNAIEHTANQLELEAPTQ